VIKWFILVISSFLEFGVQFSQCGYTVYVIYITYISQDSFYKVVECIYLTTKKVILMEGKVGELLKKVQSSTLATMRYSRKASV